MMRIIKTQQDIDVLRRVGILTAAILGEIEDYFLQLRDEQRDENGQSTSFRVGLRVAGFGVGD
jgi:hypothetical protein